MLHLTCLRDIFYGTVLFLHYFTLRKALIVLDSGAGVGPQCRWCVPVAVCEVKTLSLRVACYRNLSMLPISPGSGAQPGPGQAGLGHGAQAGWGPCPVPAGEEDQHGSDRRPGCVHCCLQLSDPQMCPADPGRQPCPGAATEAQGGGAAAAASLCCSWGHRAHDQVGFADCTLLSSSLFL